MFRDFKIFVRFQNGVRFVVNFCSYGQTPRLIAIKWEFFNIFVKTYKFLEIFKIDQKKSI